MPKIQIPIINQDLIKYLETLFPDKCATLEQSEREIFYKSGQRSVVNHLIEQFKIQQEE
jgi:hypothetical protein